MVPSGQVSVFLRPPCIYVMTNTHAATVIAVAEVHLALPLAAQNLSRRLFYKPCAIFCFVQYHLAYSITGGVPKNVVPRSPKTFILLWTKSLQRRHKGCTNYSLGTDILLNDSLQFLHQVRELGQTLAMLQQRAVSRWRVTTATETNPHHK